MKRSYGLVFAIIVLFGLCLITSYAHSGGTDSDGGHHKDNGEYHYHHGYPEHDHEDMDGDGDLDCPYEFKDNEKENQGGNAQIKKTEEAKNTTKHTPEHTESKKENQEKSFDFLKYINSLFPSLVISFPLSAVIYCILAKFNDNIKDMALIWIYTISTLIVSIAMYQSS